MKLTAKAVAATKFIGKPIKAYDGHGLHLYVTKTSRVWRYSYRLDGKSREFTLGDAALISLADARELHREARRLVQAGDDPVADRRDKREAVKQERLTAVKDSTTFDQCSNAWLDRKQYDWSSTHFDKTALRLKSIPAWFLEKPVVEITPDDVVRVLTPRIEAGKNYTAHTIKGLIDKVFVQAITRDVIEANPALHPKVLDAIGKRPRTTNYPHITDEKLLADVLISIDFYTGNQNVRNALRLLTLVFTRPSEVRELQWSEIQIDRKTWIIPAPRTKSKRDHFVPLSDQSVDVLNQQRERVRADCPFVFPGRDGKSPISNMTMGTALKRLGFDATTICPHGFRATASSFLNGGRVVDNNDDRQVFRGDVIEAQLAHLQPGVRGVYNRAEYHDERVELMQAWACFLDQIKEKHR